VKLTSIPEGVIDWSWISAATVPGATAAASARARQLGDIQLRVVEYAPGYLADHWCSKGHILYVVSGELAIEHRDGQVAYGLSAGMSWHVADDEGTPHRVRSPTGATIFILD
jgi:quercetin dioxygenase-like cupin family protein